MEFLTVIQILLLLLIVKNTVLSAQKMTPYDCSCGEIFNKAGDRIIGGKPTKPNAYPWHAAIKLKGGYVCGATVINDYYAITAAHCRVTAENHTVHLGLHRRDKPNPKRHQVYKIEQVKKHEQYHGAKYDISLLKLERRITFTHFVKPVCLPNKHENFEGEKAYVIGWGYEAIHQRNLLKKFLREAQVTVWTKEDCGTYNTFHTASICAFGTGKGICGGDSGGPLFYVNKYGKAVQIGVSSFQIGKCGGPKPDFFTSLQILNDWIRQNTRDGRYCYREI